MFFQLFDQQEFISLLSGYQSYLLRAACRELLFHQQGLKTDKEWCGVGTWKQKE